MPKALAGVDIADMHFNSGNLYPDQRVVQRDRGVGIAARIDDDAGRLLRIGLMNEVDQFAFTVRLPAVRGKAELRRGVRA